MKKNLKSLTALFMAVVMCACMCAGLSVSAENEAVTEVLILDDEAGKEFSGFSCVLSQDMAKVGTNSYKCTTANANLSECWFMRGNPGGVDISAVTEGGAVRFWIYVEDVATVHNWGGTQVQLGDAWDANVYKWNGWHTQIVNNGWNEIILPFANGGTATVDATNVTWFFIKMQNTTYATTVYIDNVRATADCVPEETEVVLATAEWSAEISNTGFCAVPSDEKAAVGKYSYKSWPGQPGGSDFWIIRGNLTAADLSGVTQSGTAGALRFKIYVDDISTLDGWNGSQVQLGSGSWDSNVYAWGDFRAQIINNSWNDIVLPFANAAVLGTPDIAAVTYINIRTASATYATTVYIDDIRVTSGAEARADISVLNEEIGEGAFTECNTSISTEQAKVGTKSYKANPTSSYWVLRSSGSPGGLARSYDISTLTNNGTTGALRFWVYVEDISEVAGWNGSQVQYGYHWDNNSFVWNSWHTQITKNGWNEIVLPFANAGKAGTPDVTNMCYFFIKLGASCDTVLYVDDIRVTASAANSEDVKLVNEEQGVGLNGSGFCSVISSEQASEGSNSFKNYPGMNQYRDNWIMRGGLPRAYDLSELSLNGTSGALKFSIYVEDVTAIDDWYSESNTIFIQAALITGTDMWSNYFIWSNFQDQITQNGWNEIVLPFVNAGKSGSPSIDNITYMWIRVGNAAHTVTSYIDNVRFESRKVGDVNADYYTDADDIAAIRKALLGITEADSFADVNGSGALDIADLIRLKKNIAA